MKKFFFILSIIILIFLTTITKNSTKKIDKKIFEAKESIRILKNQYEYVLLDYNYLSSPDKLMDYQLEYFENLLVPIDINNTKKILINNNKIKIISSNNNFNDWNKRKYNKR